MKELVFVLFPLMLFAQNPILPDTLVLKTGKVYPCLVTDINESVVRVIYRNNRRSASGMKQIEQIMMDKMGVVYQADRGFLISPDSVETYLARLDSSALLNKGEKQERRKKTFFPEEGKQQINRWSFGIVYVPYYSGKIFTFTRDPYYSTNITLDSYSNSRTFMEGQFSFLLDPQFRITLNIGFNTSYSQEKDELYFSYLNQGGGTNTGNIVTENLKIFDLTLGLKYYLKELVNHKVSAYIIGGVGKQIASFNYETKELFEPTSSSTLDDNLSEFIKDLNSPIHLNLGFGTEYAFNESISLFSSIRFIYLRRSGLYDYRYVSSTQIQTGTKNYKNSEIVTYIGLGFNFYF